MKKSGDRDTAVERGDIERIALESDHRPGPDRKTPWRTRLCEDGLGRQQIVRHVANGPSSAQVTEYLLIYLCDLKRSGWQVLGAAPQGRASRK